MHKKKIKIGVWGIGRHAQKRILPAITKCQNVELVSIYSRDESKGRLLAKKFKTNYISNLDEFLSVKHLDYVYLTTPSGLHFENLNQIAEANLNAFCEKPLCTSLKTAKMAFDLFEQKNCFLIEAMMYKFGPQLKILNKVMLEKLVGELASINISFTLPETFQDTFRKELSLGGGATLDLACYHLSLLYELFSEKPMLNHSCIHKEGDTDKRGHANLNIGIATCNLFWGYGLSYTNSVELIGSNGRFVFNKIFTGVINNETTAELFDFQGKLVLSEVFEDQNLFDTMLSEFHCSKSLKETNKKQKEEILWRTEMIENIFENSALLF